MSISENYYNSYVVRLRSGKLLRRWMGTGGRQEVLAVGVEHVAATVEDDVAVLAIVRGLEVEVVDGKGRQLARFEVDVSNQGMARDLRVATLKEVLGIAQAVVCVVVVFVFAVANVPLLPVKFGTVACL